MFHMMCLAEPDDVNPTMDAVDVAVVIGANDVVNPSATEEPGSPIYGMPIIEVHNAKTVFVSEKVNVFWFCWRSKSPIL